jgi:hypothetical protein
VGGFLVVGGFHDRPLPSLPWPGARVEPRPGDLVVLAQPTGAFPLDHPVVDGDAVYALRGHGWDPKRPLTDEAAASAHVTDVGRRLAAAAPGTAVEVSGLCTVVSLSARVIHVTTDPSGLLPVYLWAEPGRAVVSSHERVVARAAGAAMDPVGVVQTGAFGYAIGERTLHLGIRQLPAGSTATIDRETGRVVVADHPTLYGPIPPDQPLDAAADQVWSLYREGLPPAGPGPAGILMSGGFDTRLVTLGLVDAGHDLVALTIGDEGNHEVEVARRVAELSGADWRRRTATPDLDGLEGAAEQMLDQAESLCFPTCWFGARELAERGARTASTGYGGETVLGGQGGTQFLGAADRTHRILDVVRRGTGRTPERRPVVRADLEPVLAAMVAHHRVQLDRMENRVAADLRTAVARARDDLAGEIEAELVRYLAPGPTALEQVAERFWFEHHVRKHFGRQEITLDAVLPLLLPTISTPLLLHLSTLDPHLKVDHRTYLRMVRRHFGPYARIPTSNIPVRLDRPTPVLWAARTARAVWDDRQTAIQQRTKGARGRRFGWSNYEVWARQSSLFDQLPRLIRPWLVDPEWLARKLAKQESWQERVFSAQEHLVLATVSGLVEP